MSDRFVVISGCSGGGKSTLLAELQARGRAVAAEPGRRIVQAEQARGGRALPWIDLAAFARRAMETALEDRREASRGEGWVFFDRALVDAACALEQATGEPATDALKSRHRYHRRVFLAPPWPEIYVADPERRHGLDAAVAEYERLARAYPALGYETILLPKTTPAERADFVLETLGAAPSALAIRPGRAEERTALGALKLRASLAWGDFVEELRALPEVGEVSAEQAERAFVAELDGRLVGFGVVLADGHGRAELDDLFVEPDRWGLGVGRRLVEEALRRAARVGAQSLHVVAGRNAQGFYEALGFERVGEVQTQFEIALAMRRLL